MPELGCQTPRLSVHADYDLSYGGEACELAADFDLTAFEFQELILDVVMAVGPDGKWAHTSSGFALPRQNGKGGAVEIRALWGLLRGERILWTLHDSRIAEALYGRFASFFDEENGPLRKYLGRDDPHDSKIITTVGSSIQFVTRVSGNGRGESYDLLILDEAQELDTGDEEALRPMVSASDNGQIIYTGTPPRTRGQGEPFLRFRKQALTRLYPRFSWQEWSANRANKTLSDPAGWLQANPRIGQGMTIESVEDDYLSMSPEGFARERLGMFDTIGDENRVFSDSLWSALADPDSVLPASQYLTLETDAARLYTSIMLSGALPSGKVYLELAASFQGTDRAPDEIESMLNNPSYNILGVLIDEKSATATLLDEFKRRRIRVHPVTTPDIALATGLFHDAVFTGRVVHINQAQLNNAVSMAEKKVYGKYFYWVRKKGYEEQGNIISVASTGYWAAVTEKTIRKPVLPAEYEYAGGRREPKGKTQKFSYVNGRRVYS